METEESKFELDMHICPKIYRAVYASNFVESNEDFWLGKKKNRSNSPWNESYENSIEFKKLKRSYPITSS